MLHLKGNLLPAKQGKIFTALWSPANDSVDAREMEIVCSSLSQPLDLGTGSIMDGVCTSQQAGNFADCEKVKSNPGEQQLSMCSDPRDREIPPISQKMQHWRFTFFSLAGDLSVMLPTSFVEYGKKIFVFWQWFLGMICPKPWSEQGMLCEEVGDTWKIQFVLGLWLCCSSSGRLPEF